MNTEALTAMLALAAATPLIAWLAWQAHGRASESCDTPVAPRTRRNLLLLACAGPLNLLLWCVFNLWLERRPLANTYGYILAAGVFIVASIVTGLASRHLRRAKPPISQDDKPSS